MHQTETGHPPTLVNTKTKHKANLIWDINQPSGTHVSPPAHKLHVKNTLSEIHQPSGTPPCIGDPVIIMNTKHKVAILKNNSKLHMVTDVQHLNSHKKLQMAKAGSCLQKDTKPLSVSWSVLPQLHCHGACLFTPHPSTHQLEPGPCHYQLLMPSKRNTSHLSTHQLEPGPCHYQLVLP